MHPRTDLHSTRIKMTKKKCHTKEKHGLGRHSKPQAVRALDKIVLIWYDKLSQNDEYSAIQPPPILRLNVKFSILAPKFSFSNN